EGGNWGLTTYGDNAYDGQEDVVGTVTCSPPLSAYSCGGEPPYPTWQPNAAVSPPKGPYALPVGNRIQVVIGGTNYVFDTTKTGTTSGSAPSWPTTAGSTLSDGTAAWKNVATKSNANGFGDLLS